MKTKLFMLCAIVCAIFLTCCEEEEPATSRKVETGKVSEITLTSAMFHGVVNVDISQYNDVTFGIMISNSKAELNERGGEMFKAKALLGKDFKIEIGNLEPETKYYYCAWLFLNSTQYEFGDIKEFETIAPTIATVTTNPITQVQTSSAVAGGCVKNDGGASVTERGVVYSLSKEPTTSSYKVKSGSGIGEFTCNLTNLRDNAIYYVRAYAINKKGTVYGEERYFTTKEITLPSIYTSNVTDISYTSASISGNVTDDGNAEVTERGIVYSKTQNPTTSNTKKRNGSGTGSFTCNLTDLQDGVTYYVRAYATNLKGTAYGEELSFTTLVITLPTVSTIIATNVSDKSAIVEGCVTNDGGGNITERGIVYSTTPEPTTANGKVTKGTGSGTFSCNLTNLQEATTYYARAYAINIRGVSYGEQVSFKTKFTKGFSISNSKQVYFSFGNLQYHPANKKWRFAENQTDYIGDANSNSSSTYDGWLDLFGWSTSATYYGVSTSTSISDYSGSFVDWGTNKIGNDAPNTWRTLSYDEWNYLLDARPNASSLRGVAQVNGVNGLIFLPDNWTCPSGVTFKSGFHYNSDVDYYAAYQTFTAEQWSKLESAGAVFLPAAGECIGSNVDYVQDLGCYWSASEYSGYASYLRFGSDGAGMSYNSRGFGRSVRLVKDLQ